MALLITITCIVISLYSITIFLFGFGLRKLKWTRNNVLQSDSPLTVIVPFRNEAQGISDLVHNLFAQSYPDGLIEVVFVNDHSDDGSQVILAALIAERDNFYLMELPPNRHGKKEALSFGIQGANADWIIQIDADCRIGPHFITSQMNFLKEHPSDLVAGLVTTGDGKDLFLEAYERLDLLSLVGVGAGSFYFDRPMMCNGANLCYSRELYLETRTYDPSMRVASGDDMFLMIGARKLGKKLSFNLARDAMVETRPVRNIRSMIKQRIRWGAKSAHYKLADIQLLAILVTATNLSVLLLPLWMVFSPELWLWVLMIWGLKTIADFSVLSRITKITGQRNTLWFFLPVSLLYYLSFLVIICSSVFRQSTWKSGVPK